MSDQQDRAAFEAWCREQRFESWDETFEECWSEACEYARAERAMDASRADDPGAVQDWRATDLAVRSNWVRSAEAPTGEESLASFRAGWRMAEDRAASVIEGLRENVASLEVRLNARRYERDCARESLEAAEQRAEEAEAERYELRKWRAFGEDVIDQTEELERSWVEGLAKKHGLSAEPSKPPEPAVIDGGEVEYCSTCRFWWGYSGVLGHCRRYAPRPGDMPNEPTEECVRPHRVSTGRGDWCGEYEARARRQGGDRWLTNE